MPDLVLGTWLAPGDWRTLLASLARVLDHGEEAAIAVGLEHPPQPRRNLHLTIQLEGSSATGEPPAACRVLLSDTTDITQVRAALLAQQQFLQSVIDGIGDIIVVIGTDYQLLLMNQAAGQATGVSAKDICGLTCYRAIHGRDTPCDSAEHPCPVPEVLASGRPVKVVHCDRWADGETYWVEVVGSPLLGLTGEVLGVIESVRDITLYLGPHRQAPGARTATGTPGRARPTDRAA
ncbi:PAS domain-containing protein [uncultured Thiodictyon sp.]|uniref:PAS domain-containing protein n=1 Tax=uncultured Thiodictyon sp. TaxID=1846217 RepID=UPI0034489079